MSPIDQDVADYLAMRRALGYQLTDHGRVLPQFAAFLQQRGESLITTALALEFAMLPAHASVVWWHQRLAMVRGFARYLQAFDARHEVPPVNLLPAKFRRAIPYLFSDAEILALLHAARLMRPPLRAASCEALLGLLVVSGMRVTEACRLDRCDVELAEGRLTVRHGKNGRSREIPLHPSTVEALARYARSRDELCPVPKDSAAFFLSGAGGRLYRHYVWKWFDQLRDPPGNSEAAATEQHGPVGPALDDAPRRRGRRVPISDGATLRAASSAVLATVPEGPSGLVSRPQIGRAGAWVAAGSV